MSTPLFIHILFIKAFVRSKKFFVLPHTMRTEDTSKITISGLRTLNPTQYASASSPADWYFQQRQRRTARRTFPTPATQRLLLNGLRWHGCSTPRRILTQVSRLSTTASHIHSIAFVRHAWPQFQTLHWSQCSWVTIAF